MKQWEPKDVIAMTLIVGCFILRAIGVDTVTTQILTLVAVGYGIWAGKDKLKAIQDSKRCDKPRDTAGE